MALKILATFLLLLTLYPTNPQGQWLPHRPPPHPLPLPQPESPKPLCVSQLALVNRACTLLPYAQVPPPAPPSPELGEGGEEESGGGGHHHHHHNHHRGDGYMETPEEEECCRWLKQVDTVCVCDLLVHLPPFMTRPLHEYKVIAHDSCEVTFECASRLMKF